jgi:hypothetical protein
MINKRKVNLLKENTNISLLEGQTWTCIIVGDFIINNYTPTAEPPVTNITWSVNAASLGFSTGDHASLNVLFNEQFYPTGEQANY